MTLRRLEVRQETLRLAAPFRISGYVFEAHDVIVVTISEGSSSGRGEAAGVYYLGDDAATMRAEIEQHRKAIESGAGRTEVNLLMRPGGARNAVDCALWELEAAQSGRPIWAIAGLFPPKPLTTTFTLGADDPDKMAEGARRYVQARAIKTKLTGELELDVERVRAIRAARPDVWLGVDANQGFERGDLERLVPMLAAERVAMVEQPLPRGREADLEGYRSPIPLAADESVLSSADLEGLVGRFDVINIKLDKCGGLTEALKMVGKARRLGFQVMVGNMVGTSLAMAPGFVLGQLCDVVDLDGPTFLAEDRKPGVTYSNGLVDCGEDVWGAAAGKRLAA